MGKLEPSATLAGTWNGAATWEKLTMSFHMTSMGSFMVYELHCNKKGNSVPILRVLWKVTKGASYA